MGPPEQHRGRVRAAQFIGKGEGAQMEGEGGGEQHLLGGRGKPPPHERRSLLLVLNEAFGHEVGDLHRQPRTQPQRHEVRQTKLGNVAGPQGLEVVAEANFAPSVHLGCFPIQLRDGDLRSSVGVRHRDLKLNGKFILEQLMDVPTAPGPPRALRVGLEPEPVIVRGLVVLHVLQEATGGEG